MRGVLVAFWFTWQIFSPSGVVGDLHYSDLFHDKVACENEKERKAADFIKLGLVNVGVRWEVHGCFTVDRKPK